MACFSSLSSKPASAPAPTVAKRSSLVIVASFFVGTPITFKKKFERPVNAITKGFKIRIKNRIEPIKSNAYFSGLFKPILLGIKSANKTKIIVTAKKEQKKPKEAAKSGAQK